MSSILLVTLVVSAVFACMFGLCEWVARRRHSGGEGESLTSPPMPGDDTGHADAAQLAARRRMARQLGITIDGGADSP